MSSVQSVDPATLVRVAHNLRAGKCVQMAAFTILIYDHVSTLPQEIERIWKHRFTGASLLFYLNRYITPLQYIIVITAFHHPKWVGKACDDFVPFVGYVSGIMSSICEVIMILRVYALYRRSNRVLAFLAVLWLAQLIVSIKGVSTGFAVHLPPGPAFVGCILTGTSKWFYAIWIGPLVTDTAIFALTLWRIRPYIGSSQKIPMIHIFLRDGIFYFLAIFLMNFVNALLFFLAPNDLKPIGAPFSAMMTTLMISRLVLNLRSAPSAGIDIVETNVISRPKEPIVFRARMTRALGKLGDDFETSRDYRTIDAEKEEEWTPHSRSTFNL
ncbi:unnamed protein product [Cyclocybe aegerita]|uniref:DUF6533 domain-containing protein n=1 Tax=Cyclocybe aegerita TaxID=1973307 RepID=A0A8S0WXI9_CYCAE|nr:unnamed protein product [Cyclocybe aegerita]